MIRTIIIEEDGYRREKMADTIRFSCPDVFILSLCCDPAEAKAAITEIDPDLVISNTDFPAGNVFELLLGKLSDVKFRTIIVSASPEFALEAIKYRVLDYLVIPFEDDTLTRSVNFALGEIRKDYILQSYILSESLYRESSPHGKLVLRTSSQIILVPFDEIVYCREMHGRSFFLLQGGKQYDTPEPIEHFTGILRNRGFIRISKSLIVNTRHIERFEKSGGGYAVLKDGERVRLSNRVHDQLKYLFRASA